MSKTHRFPIQFYWEDTGAAGIVYNTTYLRFLKRDRSDLAMGAGIDKVALLDSEGVMFPLRRCEIGYLQPTNLEDQIKVRTRIREIGGTSRGMALDFQRGDEHIVRAKVRLASVGQSGRPQRLTAQFPAVLDEITIAS